MRLIGMLDSPFVRRVAISMQTMGLRYEHENLSVFSTYNAFAAINPVVKAPTLVTDSGVVLMESSLILEYLERLAPEKSLSPPEAGAFARSQRIVGLALAACEKSVQIVYERNLRPSEKQHAPWTDRVTAQLHGAYRLLEAELPPTAGWIFGPVPLQGDITSAIAWRFSREMIPDVVPADGYPRLAQLSVRAEALPAFLAAPFG